MELAKDNFYSTELTSVFKVNGQPDQRIPVKRYTYESNSKLYDVDVMTVPLLVKGEVITKVYRINSNQASLEPYSVVHNAIEQHFKL